MLSCMDLHFDFGPDILAFGIGIKADAMAVAAELEGSLNLGSQSRQGIAGRRGSRVSVPVFAALRHIAAGLRGFRAAV